MYRFLATPTVVWIKTELQALDNAIALSDDFPFEEHFALDGLAPERGDLFAPHWNRSWRAATPLPGSSFAGVVRPYYLKIPAIDQPGVFAEVADILSRHDISVERDPASLELIGAMQLRSRYLSIILVLGSSHD